MKPLVLCAALLMAQHISVDVDLVVLNVTVLDFKARRVGGLSKDNFRVFEDGVEQRIQFVRPEDIPATVGLVIDNSGSMRRKKADVTQTALEFAELSNPQDELFTVNFNERVSMGLPDSLPFTSDMDQFRRALAAVKADGKTALYDGVVSALKHLETGTHQRRALIVLSDGGDNASAAGLEDVLHAAENSSATIYTIGIFDDDDKDKNPKVLRQIADATGGDAYLPQRPDDVHEAWRKIAASIRTQYTIGYAPTNSKHDGTFRAVTVSAIAPNGKPLRVRARKGYIAPTEHRAFLPGPVKM
ncbi:MAG TPA: VWA domain-containing protein [Terriglobia bacterium]|nr:VWA domain-containing protein [Terriglobia bacterium]